MLLSVVAPVFRNQESLPLLVDQLRGIRDTMLQQVDLEIVLVDDGSDDDSWSVMQRLSQESPELITLVRLSRNFGQVSAIMAGLERATGDAVAVISADLQDPPEVLVEMWNAHLAGSEIVVAHRVERDDSVSSRAFSRVAYGIARKSNPRIPQGGFDFVLMSARASKYLCSFKGRHRFFQGDVLWMGFTTAFIPYHRRARQHGRSGWTLSKKWKYFVDLSLDGSYYPIQLMSRLGILLALAGVLYAIVIGFAWLFSRTPFPGWAPIMVTLLLVGGVLMVMLGIIGEYLWRIYDEIRERPLYIVAESRDRDSK